MLDMLCFSGEAAWARLSPAQAATPPSLVPATPIAIFLREHGEAWRSLRDAEGAAAVDGMADGVLAALRERGAMFFRDLAPACWLDAEALRQALAALVAAGLVTSDGFAGVRAILLA